MAGKIIADTIQAAGSYITLNVGNVTILTANSTGLTLTPSSNLNFNVTNSIWTASPGSNSAPSLTFSGNTSTGIFFPSTNTVAISTAATEALRVDSAGNVGIGTALPGANLDVQASTGPYVRIKPSTGTSYGFLGFSNTGGDFNIGRESSTGGSLLTGSSAYASVLNSFGAYPMQFGTNGALAMTIDSSGNLGIGESASIVRKLCITASGTTATTRAGIQLKNEVGTTAEIYQGPTSNNALIFEENGSERMRIDTSGSLLIATTSSSTTSVGAGFQLLGAGVNGAYVNIGHTSGAASGYSYLIFSYTNSTIGGVQQNGTTGVTYATTSDYRLKNTITPMTGALAKVALLKPCTYKWNSDGSNGQGFIAHELQEVVGDCVTGTKDAVDAEGNPVYQGIDTSFLVATLTAAIQELKTIVDAQAVEIAALKAK